MAEGARLESVYIARYRGFESLPHRHNLNPSDFAVTGVFFFGAVGGSLRALLLLQALLVKIFQVNFRFYAAVEFGFHQSFYMRFELV